MIEPLLEDLQFQQEVCEALLGLVEKEGSSLRSEQPVNAFDLYQTKKNLLPRLNQSLDQLRKHRLNWQRLTLGEREKHPRINASLRRNQDLIMKIIVLDRENEQTLLRRGLVPTRHLPAANRQRPHYVADLYRRSGAGE